MEILNISWNNNNKTHTLYKMWSTLVIKYAYQAILQLYRVGFLNMQWNCSARKSAWDIYELATNCRSCRSKYTQMRPEVAFTVGATWKWPGEHSNRTEIRRCNCGPLVHCTNGWKAPSALVWSTAFRYNMKRHSEYFQWSLQIDVVQETILLQLNHHFAIRDEIFVHWRHDDSRLIFPYLDTKGIATEIIANLSNKR